MLQGVGTMNLPYNLHQDPFGNWFVEMKTVDGQSLVLCQTVNKSTAEYLVEQLNKGHVNESE